MKRILVIAFSLVLVVLPSFGQALTSSTYNFTLDLPEGFELVDTNQKDRFLFTNRLAPCQLQISYDRLSKFSNTEKASESIFNQLSQVKHKDIQFLWCEHEAQLSSFTFRQSVECTGWLLVLKLKECWLTLIAYSESSVATKCEPIIISALDSIYTTPLSFYVPGPVTSCLYAREDKFEKTQINFAGKDISFFVNPIDAEAAQSVVDREFAVLTLSLNTNSLEEAWQRYYRTIFRDSWERLQSFSFEIKNLIFEKGLQNNRLEILKLLAEHVQNYSYMRLPQGTDFVDLVTACTKQVGDCDTRCLLLNVVLAQLGIRSVLFVSPEFGHALCGVDIPGQGARLSDGTTSYLVVETTAKVAPGYIAADIANEEKWFSVNLYGLLQ